jgi:hypothetical protein
MLGMIISMIVFTWSPIYIKLFLAYSVCEPMVSHVHGFGPLLFDFSFKIPNAVELSVLRGVAGCVCPNSVRVTLRGAPLWVLWKQAPTSDSAADATTFFMTEAAFRMEPLSLSAWGVCRHNRTIHLVCCGRGKLINKMRRCGCEVSCLRHDI